MKIKKFLKNFSFDMITFYKFGRLCFIVIGSANLIGYMYAFTGLPWYFKISGAFSILFNYAIALTFDYLLKQAVPKELPAPEELKPLTPEQIRAFMSQEVEQPQPEVITKPQTKIKIPSYYDQF